MSETIYHSEGISKTSGGWYCLKCGFADKSLDILELHIKAKTCAQNFPVEKAKPIPCQMTQIEYLVAFEALMAEELKTTRIKNADYAQADDAFANFKLIAEITQGRISLEDGILCRITDKLKRVAGLLKNPAMVKEESLDDNLKDISVYCRIWRVYRHHQLRQK